jgi:GT2 family glycosyltransferase/glycosyltransferase involved in cell wall biosynthesis
MSKIDSPLPLNMSCPLTNPYRQKDPLDTMTQSIEQQKCTVKATNQTIVRQNNGLPELGQLSQAVNFTLAVCILFYEKLDQTIECIESFLPSGVRIYVLNNHSSPTARDLLGLFCRSHQQITIFDSDVNLGVSVGRNFLITHTTEDWLFFVDNDIYVTSNDWFQTFSAYILRYPEVEVFIPRLYNIHEQQFVTYFQLAVDQQRVLYYPIENNTTSCFPGGASCISRILFDRLGKYDDKMFVGLEDFEFCIRAILRGAPVRSRVIDDIELRHDHRQVTKMEDTKAVLTRYNDSSIERSFHRIAEKFPGLIFQHDWRPWVADQRGILLGNRNLDLSLTTPVREYGSGSSHRQFASPQSLHFSHNSSDFFQIANQHNPSRVVIFGCPAEDRAFEAFHQSSLSILGIVMPHHNELDQARFPGVHWIGCDLTDYQELEDIFPQLESEEPQVFIIFSILEQLEDPRPILRTLRRLLCLNHDNRAIIEFFDRLSVASTSFALRFQYTSLIRQWSQNELEAFLSSSGFIIEDNPYATENTPMRFIILRLTAEAYDSFLETHHLPSSQIKYVIISSEHGKGKLTGGIGSYVEEQARLFSKTFLGICFLGTGELLPETCYINEEQLILPSIFFPSSYIDTLPMVDVALSMIEQVVFFYPNVRLIECQDILGYFCRIVQAKACGLLPSAIRLSVHCHGSRIQIENAFHIWYEVTSFESMYEEKIAIEYADMVIFPTQYLHHIYHNQGGYSIEPHKVKSKRLPFTYNSTFPTLQYQPIDTIIFFGKRIHYKGFTVFADAIKKFLEMSDFSSTVKTFVLLGPKFNFMSDENTFFESLSSHYRIIELSLKRADALATIAQYAGHALCITPYLADNHPYTVLEVLNTGCPLLATASGGIPELIPEQFHSFLLCQPEPSELAECIHRTIAMPVERRGSLMQQVFAALTQEQSEINQQGCLAIEEITQEPMSESATPTSPLAATLIVPCDHSNFIYIKELLRALNQQVVKPSVVYFVNDGLGPEASEEVSSILAKHCQLPYKILRQVVRKGKAEAKNVALQQVQTPVIIVIEPYYLPRPHFVKWYLRYFERNPEAPLVTCYQDVHQGQPLNDRRPQQQWPLETFRPLGDASMLTGQLFNHFGHANSGYRTAFLKEVGGWDSHRTPFHDDWALFLKTRSLGKQIGVVPRSLLVGKAYATDQGTVSPATPYLTEQKLARNTLQLPRFDAFRLQAVMRQYQMLQLQVQQLQCSQQEDSARHEKLVSMLQEKDYLLTSRDHELSSIKSSPTWRLRGWIKSLPGADRILNYALNIFRTIREYIVR